MPDRDSQAPQSSEYDPQGHAVLRVLVYVGFALLVIGVATAVRSMLDGIGSWVAG